MTVNSLTANETQYENLVSSVTNQRYDRPCQAFFYDCDGRRRAKSHKPTIIVASETSERTKRTLDDDDYHFRSSLPSIRRRAFSGIILSVPPLAHLLNGLHGVLSSVFNAIAAAAGPTTKCIRAWLTRWRPTDRHSRNISRCQHSAPPPAAWRTPRLYLLIVHSECCELCYVLWCWPGSIILWNIFSSSVARSVVSSILLPLSGHPP